MDVGCLGSRSRVTPTRTRPSRCARGSGRRGRGVGVSCRSCCRKVLSWKTRVRPCSETDAKRCARARPTRERDVRRPRSCPLPCATRGIIKIRSYFLAVRCAMEGGRMTPSASHHTPQLGIFAIADRAPRSDPSPPLRARAAGPTVVVSVEHAEGLLELPPRRRRKQPARMPHHGLDAEAREYCACGRTGASKI